MNWKLFVLLAVMVSTAVLTGALVVGDSVRHSLMMMVKARLGATELALVSQNRFFTAALADELAGVQPDFDVRNVAVDPRHEGPGRRGRLASASSAHPPWWARASISSGAVGIGAGSFAWTPAAAR